MMEGQGLIGLDMKHVAVVGLQQEHYTVIAKMDQINIILTYLTNAVTVQESTKDTGALGMEAAMRAQFALLERTLQKTALLVQTLGIVCPVL
jgi:hypothetical protein